MNKSKLYLHSLLLLVVCCFILCTTALAASGFLRVVIVDESKEYVQDYNVEICLVASYDGSKYTLKDEFSTLGITPDNLANDLSVQRSEQIYKFVLDNGIIGQVLATNEQGAADFENIENGLYLVFERGGQTLSFRPYLVAIPADADTNPQYSVYSVPKTLTGETQNLTVRKVWVDNENAANKRPEVLDITLFKDGSPVRNVTLSENCNWQHTFYSLPKGNYTVEEANLADYTASLAQDGDTFTLTNTYTPPQVPDEPELPQTGFKMWPVYVLLVSGCVLVILGLADICLKREEQ